MSSIIDIVIDCIEESIDGMRAYRAVPSDRPESFAVVELTGGRWVNAVQRSPAVGVDCWAASNYEAETLAESVAAALVSMPDKVENVFHVSIESIYNNQDIDSGTPRYTVGATLTVNE